MRRLSKSARKRISEAQKARWAKKRMADRLANGGSDPDPEPAEVTIGLKVTDVPAFIAILNQGDTGMEAMDLVRRIKDQLIRQITARL